MTDGRTPIRAAAALCLMIAATTLAGCAASHYLRPDARSRLRHVSVIGLAPPEIRVFTLEGSGDTRAERLVEENERSAKAIAGFFEGSEVTVKLLEPFAFDQSGRELLEVSALARAMHKSMHRFWNPVEAHRDYGWGTLDNLAEHYGVDAFMFMDASEARVQGPAREPGPMDALAAGSIYGPRSAPRPQGARAAVSVIGTSGSVVWAGFTDLNSLDEAFRSDDSTSRLMRSLLSGFPSYYANATE